MALSDSQANAIVYFGLAPATIKLAGTVTKGDAVGNSDGWKRALATSGSVVQQRCVAAEDGVSGQDITAYFGATLIGGSRFSSITEGGAIYVAEGSDNGEYTQTAPSTSSDATTIVGYGLLANLAIIVPNMNVDSTV